MALLSATRFQETVILVLQVQQLHLLSILLVYKCHVLCPTVPNVVV
jgi:hypothetical protein